MAIDVVMPKMGESVQEGKIIKWLKKPGDRVQRDDVLCEIATDKVDTEVPSAEEGILTEILAQAGETVAVGAPIARIGAASEVSAASAPKSAPTVAAPAAQPARATARPVSAAPPAPTGGKIEIVMPKMGESVQEGKIIKWLKKPGEAVALDDPLLEISTDKVDTEVPAPAAGTMGEIVAQEGEVIEVGNVMAYLVTGAAPAAPAPKFSESSAKPPAPAAKSAVASESFAPAAAPVAVVAAGAPPPRRISGKRFYSPLVRTIAKTENITLEELDALAGTGLEGRVTKNDVLAYLKSRTARPAAPPAPAPQQPPKIEVPRGTPAVVAGEEVEIVEMDYVRQLIAEHMVRSKHTSAHVTAVHECDMTAVERFRAANKESFKQREGFSLTPTPFIVKAAAQALREFPFVNASVDGTKIYVKKHINIGVATALPDGNLIVPVLRDADGLSITGIARGVYDLAARARNKKLKPDEIQGGTFTITNYGIFGSLFGAPIINQPQVAILGTGAIQKRPVVRELDGTDYIIIRSMLYLSLSHDHRLVDGMMGGQFMSRLVQLLEGFDAAKTKL